MSKRDERKQRVRRDLADAAVSLTLERGFDAFRIEDIVEAAGVSRRTFFRYFESKEQAFFFDNEQDLLALAENLSHQKPGESAYDRVQRGLLELAQQYVERASMVRRRHQAIQRSKQLLAYDLGLDHRAEAIIIAALTPPEATPLQSLECRVLGCALFGVVRAVLRPWLEATEVGDLRAQGELAMELLEQGIRKNATNVNDINDVNYAEQRASEGKPAVEEGGRA